MPSSMDESLMLRRLRRWSGLVAVAQLLGTWSAIFLAFSIAVVLPVTLIHQGIEWARHAVSRIGLDIFTTHIHPPAPTAQSLEIAVIVAMALLVITFTRFLLRPATYMYTGQTKNMKPKPIDKGHGAQAYLDRLAQVTGVRRPKLLMIHHPGIVAYASSAPMRRSRVVVSDGLLACGQPQIIRWVLAHELAHLHYRDTQRSALIVSTLDSLVLADQMRVLATNSMLRLLTAIPLLKWTLTQFVGRPMMLLSRLLGYCMTLAFKLASLTYRLSDSFASRRMEYRADLFAASHEGIDPGIALFMSIDSDFEPTLQLFGSHPTPQQRIAALQAFAAVPQASV